jgi:hypothetical protein
MATPVDQLSDVDLEAAKKHLAALTDQVCKEASKNPGPGWEPVIDRLEEGWAKLDEEARRRAAK